MAYSHKETASADWWVNQMETKTVSLKVTTSTSATLAQEGAVSGGEEISQSAFEAVTDALVGHDTEVGIWLRVGVRPPHH